MVRLGLLIFIITSAGIFFAQTSESNTVIFSVIYAEGALNVSPAVNTCSGLGQSANNLQRTAIEDFGRRYTESLSGRKVKEEEGFFTLSPEIADVYKKIEFKMEHYANKIKHPEVIAANNGKPSLPQEYKAAYDRLVNWEKRMNMSAMSFKLRKYNASEGILCKVFMSEMLLKLRNSRLIDGYASKLYGLEDLRLIIKEFGRELSNEDSDANGAISYASLYLLTSLVTFDELVHRKNEEGMTHIDSLYSSINDGYITVTEIDAVCLPPTKEGTRE